MQMFEMSAQRAMPTLMVYLSRKLQRSSEPSGSLSPNHHLATLYLNIPQDVRSYLRYPKHAREKQNFMILRGVSQRCAQSGSKELATGSINSIPNSLDLATVPHTIPRGAISSSPYICTLFEIQ